MAIQQRETLRRRAILSGAFGAIAALAGRAVSGPDSADAAGDPAAVHKGVNNPTSATTTITNTAGIAFKGVTNTSSQNKAGVVGVSNSPHASGVFGQGVFGVSGFGTGTTGAGVVGSSSKAGGSGLLGLNQSTSGDAVGVNGESKSGSGIGVQGRATATSGVARRGVLGFGKDAGVVGESPRAAMQALGGTVGIEAFASDSAGVAVRGDVSDGGLSAIAGHFVGGAGVAVRGEVSNDQSAIAGHFVGGGSNHAIALKTEGPIQFGGSSGFKTIPAGQTHANVTGVYCPPGSKLFATLQELPGTPNDATVQLCARLNDSSFEILLTHATTDAVKVAWLIIL